MCLKYNCHCMCYTQAWLHGMCKNNHIWILTDTAHIILLNVFCRILSELHLVWAYAHNFLLVWRIEDNSRDLWLGWQNENDVLIPFRCPRSIWQDWAALFELALTSKKEGFCRETQDTRKYSFLFLQDVVTALHDNEEYVGVLDMPTLDAHYL